MGSASRRGIGIERGKDRYLEMIHHLQAVVASAACLLICVWAAPDVLTLPQQPRRPVSFSSPAARKLLDHTETHNIQILQDIKAAEKAAKAALIVRYNDTTEAQPAQAGCDLCVPEDGKMRLALNELFHAMDGYWWKNYSNWRKPVNYCNWGGLSCDAYGRLQTVNLEAYGMFGTIPESIGALTSIRELSLACNELYGELPQSVGNLTNLNYLDLHGNDLVGALPRGLANVSSLLWIDLTYNRLGEYDWLDGQPSQPWESWGSLTEITGGGVSDSPNTVFLQLDPFTNAGRMDTLWRNSLPAASPTPGAGGTVPVDEIDNEYADKTPRTVS